MQTQMRQMMSLLQTQKPLPVEESTRDEDDEMEPTEEEGEVDKSSHVLPKFNTMSHFKNETEELKEMMNSLFQIITKLAPNNEEIAKLAQTMKANQAGT